jgi:hypothetical protein
VVVLRQYVRFERGLTRKQVDAVPYWKAGEAEESYHNERHRVMDEDEGEAQIQHRNETTLMLNHPR